MTRIRGLKEVIERDEAVSPIIATILLVAITVILASTLYLALGGFFKSGTSASPTATVSVTNSTSSTAPGYVYSVSVGTPTSAVALSNVILKITFSNGTIGSTTALSTTGQKIYENVIPRNVKLPESSSFGKPIILYDINSKGAVYYIELTKEFLSKVA